MYQYSLNWFVDLFVKAIRNAESSKDIEQRIKTLNEYFTYSLYAMVCCSLFEKHKLMFAFMLAVKLLQDRGLINEVEYRFLLAGSSGSADAKRNPAPDWLSDKIWNDIVCLAELESFENFDVHFSENLPHYKATFDAQNAHLRPLAGKWVQIHLDFKICCQGLPSLYRQELTAISC